MRCALVLALLLTGCAGSGTPSAPGSPDASEALVDVWGGLDEGVVRAQQDNRCVESFGTYFADFGARGLGCAVSLTFLPEALLARAPVAPFRSGPHLATAQAVRLDLGADPSFGRYDPQFVRWFAEAVVPEGAAARALVRPIYDQHVRRIARLYWLAQADLSGRGFPGDLPPGPFRVYSAYLDGGPVPSSMTSAEGGFSVYAFTEASRALLPELALPIENEWLPTYEANTAYGFWIRREADGTRGLWLDALDGLLQTFDRAWLTDARS